MPDRRLAGDAPPADTTKFPPGTTWIEVVERAADATHMTVGVSVWSTVMPDLIAYNASGPGQDMPAGPWIGTFKPVAWSAAPAGGNVGRVDHDFVVIEPNSYQFYAHVGSVDLSVSTQVGPIGEGQMGAFKDPEVLAKLTPQGRQKEIRRTASILANNPTNQVGSPSGARRR